MITRFWNFLGVKAEETGAVGLLLAMGFLMGLFLATVVVASQTLFLNHFNEQNDLPLAIFYSGILGLILTFLYNFLQGRISFKTLAIIFIIIIILLTAFIEFGFFFISSETSLYQFGFWLILPFTFITQLIFWGAFSRIFNARDSKRLINSVDLGNDTASIVSFFSIPIILSYEVKIESLYTIGLVSIIGFLILFIILSVTHITHQHSNIKSESEIKKLSIGQFFRNRYILFLSSFIIFSSIALRFVDYSFYNVSTTQFDTNTLPYFLSFFEATVVIFAFLFRSFAADRLTQDYGLRVSLLINPLLLIFFTVTAVALGIYLDFNPLTADKGQTIYFFIAIAMSKLFANSLKSSLDTPTFKFYYIPIDKAIKIDAQTKIEGIVMALSSVIAGGLIVLINKLQIINLVTITSFILPISLIWYWITNKMHKGYQSTLEESLLKNKNLTKNDSLEEHTISNLLAQQTHTKKEERIVYGLKLTEQLEPSIFKSLLTQLSKSSLKIVQEFSLNKLKLLANQDAPITELILENSDKRGISIENLVKLSRSPKPLDRQLCAQLLVENITSKNIFILLELLRDVDSKVRTEAIWTAQKIKRPETWGLLIEQLSSPLYTYKAAAALKEAGNAVIPYLESAFHKSGQSELVMTKIIQIMGHIGGDEGLSLLWKKIDYPDKQIVKEVLYSLRLKNIKATGRYLVVVKELLNVEMNKTFWNLAAIDELPNEPHFEYLKEALLEEIHDNHNHITLLLTLIYDTESVRLVRTNLDVGTPDSVHYALELLDIFLDPDIKPKLIPLLDDTATAAKLEKLQFLFPREIYNPIQIINYILNRDFYYNNRWTKACAIQSIAYMPDFRISRGLIGQVFNRDQLLQETSAWVIYLKNKEIYNSIVSRLPFQNKRKIDLVMKNNHLQSGLHDGFFLTIEMTMFLKKLPIFNSISGKVLASLTDKITPIILQEGEKFTLYPNCDAILIQAFGSSILKNNSNTVKTLSRGDTYSSNGEKKLEEKTVKTLSRGDTYSDLFQIDSALPITEIIAERYSVLFKIDFSDFCLTLGNHYELTQKLIHNVFNQNDTLKENTLINF